MIVTTPTQLKEESAAGSRSTSDSRSPDPGIDVEDAASGTLRPSGKRFGTLVHALLASVPLAAGPAEVGELSALHGKLLGATDEEQAAARVIAVTVLKHPRMAEARAAEQAGRRVWREAPVSLRLDDGTGVPRIVDGQIDLAYETESGWKVIDFKTDVEIATAQDPYVRQVSTVSFELTTSGDSLILDGGLVFGGADELPSL